MHSGTTVSTNVAVTCSKIVLQREAVGTDSYFVVVYKIHTPEPYKSRLVQKPR